MPLTPKGTKIMKNMVSTYGSKKKAKEVFYAMINEGKLKGVESTKRKSASKKKSKK